MIVFHGTDTNCANSILLKVDVTKGGGELGRGFYAGESIGLAASFAQGRFPGNHKVVKLEIDESAFVNLKIKTIKRIEFVYRSWQNLLRQREASSFLFNFDVVQAPFATLEFSYQYKFESTRAEDVLNNSTIKTVL
jgi:hypothetical protein